MVSLSLNVGSIYIPARSIKKEEVSVVVKLSDRWNPKSVAGQYESEPKELITATLLKDPLQIKKLGKAKPEIIENWRSALAPYWHKPTEYPTKLNLHAYDLWTIPIAVFEDKKEGWVIGINEGSEKTTAAKKHRDLFKIYFNTEGYQKERSQYFTWFNGGCIKSELQDPKSKDNLEDSSSLKAIMTK